MINVSPNTRMVTLDDLKALETAKDEKAFYSVISEKVMILSAYIIKMISLRIISTPTPQLC